MQGLARDRDSAPPDRASTDEPTLGALLRSVTAQRPPRQLLEGVSVALPWAFYFGSLGLWRLSVATTAVGCLGLWAVCDRWSQAIGPSWRRAIAVAGRRVAAVATASMVAALMLDLCFRLMGSGRVY